MPELPEVETIVRYLQKKILGKKILDFVILGKSNRLLRDHKDQNEVKLKVLGKKIEDIERVGKNIIFNLSDRTRLLMHLMMTGKILLNPKEINKHDQLILKLSGNTTLVFNDVRKFGRCRILGDVEKKFVEDALIINKSDFISGLEKNKGKLKSLLLNQKLVSGIGNIYADEILWYAGIHPERRPASLTNREFEKLYTSMRKVLRLAIKKGGSSARNYRKPDGTKGGYYPKRLVYRLHGTLCKKDGALIRRIVVAGRPTHFCPTHQL